MQRLSQRGFFFSLKQPLRTLLLTGCAAVAGFNSTPIRASESQPTPSEAADRFLDALGPSDGGTALTASTPIIDPGYVYVEVERIGNPVRNSLAGNKCRNAFLKSDYNGDPNGINLRNKAIDFIFAKEYDLGLALRIPLELQIGDTPLSAQAARIELPVFGLTKDANRKCKFRPGRVDRESFRTPYIPIPTNVGYGSQKVLIELAPWAIQTADSTRVDAFWTGLGAVASLLGPIGAIGKQLFDSQNEKLTLNTQGKSAVESWFDLTEDDSGSTSLGQGAPATAKKWITSVSPAGTGTAPEMSYLLLLRNETGTESDLGFKATVKYRRSRFFEAPAAPNYSNADFSAFLNNKNDIDNKTWSEISDAVKNLANEKETGGFNSLCKLAADDLNRLGFSDGDAALLIYAVARTRFSADKIGQIGCLGLDPMRKLKETLITYQIPQPIIELQKTTNDDRKMIFEAARISLNTPNLSNLRDLLGSSIIISGKPNMVLGERGVGWLTGTKLDELTFDIAKLKLREIRQGSIVRCAVDSIGDDLPFKLPLGVPGEVADRSLAFILDQQTSSAVVLIGLSGKTSGVDGKPQISHIWVGGPSDFDADDENMQAILNKMRVKLNDAGSPGQYPCRGTEVRKLLTVAPEAAPLPGA